jgi:hypothetical protein
VSGYLHSLSARALGLGVPVKAAARLTYSAPPAILEQPTGDEPAPAIIAPRDFSVAPLPNAIQRPAVRDDRAFRDVPSLLSPRRDSDEPLERRPVHPMREPWDENATVAHLAVSAPPPAVESARAPALPSVAATPFVLPPAFASASLTGFARTTTAHRQSSSDATEVHVTIGRIDVTAVHEPATSKRRAVPVKSTVSLDEYLGKGRRARP